MTMYMAENAIVGTKRSEQPKNVHFEPIIKTLKYDIRDWDQV